MTRFHFASRPAARAPQHRTPRPAETPRPLPGESRRGPGWFDSSWDLRAGLEVREGMPDDLRLDEWLDAFCGGARNGEPALAAA